MSVQKVQFQWIKGPSYQEIWDLQTTLQQSLIDFKRSAIEQDAQTTVHQLLFCEHRPVYTLGKSAKESHLLSTEDALRKEGVELFRINRGGDITFHGPGQITGYPIFDLEKFFTDVHKYVRYLEEAVIRLLAHHQLEGIRLKEYTGVWLPPDDGHSKYRKICAIGVHLSRWVTMHGFALNVNTDTSWFDRIIPCGIDDADKTVTSLSAETGKELSMEEVGNVLLWELAELFGFEVFETESSRQKNESYT